LGVIGELAVSSGLYAAQQDDFPITVRKGFSVSSLIVSPDPILYTGLDHPDLVVLLSRDGTERFGDLSTLAENCIVVIDNDLHIGDTPARVIRMVPSAWEKELAKEAVSLAAVAFAFVVAGLIAPDLLNRAAEAGLSGPYREVNLRAIRAGAAHGEVEIRGRSFVAASGGQL
jgi:Pyruvate/2-oxoacid:ferredoxin oxidoreductase gamma subunit